MTGRKVRLLLVAFVLLLTTLFEAKVLVRPAHAVVGRPLTPVSYAGVARRTSRRTTRRAVYSGAYAAPGPAYYW